MIDHGGHVAARIILHDVPDRVQAVRQRPLYRFVSPVVNIFLGQNLIHRRAPQVTLAQVAYLHVARVGTPEIHDDLVAIVDEDPPLLGLAVAVVIQPLVNPAVGVIVGVLDHVIDRCRVACPVLHFGEPIAVIPGVLGDVRVARVELAVLIGFDEAVRPVPLGIIEVTVGSIEEEPIIRAGIARSGTVAGRDIPAEKSLGMKKERSRKGEPALQPDGKKRITFRIETDHPANAVAGAGFEHNSVSGYSENSYDTLAQPGGTQSGTRGRQPRRDISGQSTESVASSGRNEAQGNALSDRLETLNGSSDQLETLKRLARRLSPEQRQELAECLIPGER